MKTIKLFFMLVVVGGCIAACNSDIEFESELDRSEKVWLEFKKESGNSYQYAVSNSSWVGSRWTTTVTVTNGQITERAFKANLNNPDLSEEENKVEWVERGTEVNTSKDLSSFIAVLLDDIYAKARKEWLAKQKNVTTYFETQNQGMISTCGYVPDNCADDCFTGIYIDYIKRIE